MAATIVSGASPHAATAAKLAGARAPGQFNVAAHGLRGIASLMVLGAHIIGGTARHIYSHDIEYVRLVERPWYVGTFGVELFFIISGFVIAPSAIRYAPGNFALRRTLRLYPLFLVFTLLFAGLNFLTNAYPRLNNVESVLSGLLFINLFTGTEQLAPNAWSLTYEVMFYALTCLVAYFAIRRKSPILLAASIALCAAFVISFPISLFFLAGVAIHFGYRKLAVPKGLRHPLEAALLIAALSLASVGHFEYHLADLAHPVVIPLIISSSLYFLLAVSPDSLTHRAMDNAAANYFGKISYSVYLVHPFVYFAIRQIFAHYGWFTTNIGASMAAFAITVFSLSIAASHYVHLSLEQWPYQWYFRQRVYRDRAPAAAPQAHVDAAETPAEAPPR